MAEIEKKYSDFQKSECETQEEIEPIDVRLCPTCQVDPNWKLPATHWSDIDEAYLNKNSCEYHVRVYESETDDGTKEQILNLGVERILVDLDKPLNNGTRQQLFNASFIVDDYRNIESRELGVAYLVGVPAFNFDQIPPNEESDQDNETDDLSDGGKIVLEVAGLHRKLRQLKIALRTYGIYYSASVKSGAGFVIRQKNNETMRINYNAARVKIKQFEDALSDLLKDKGYPRIGKPGLFKAKRAKKLKFIFKSNGKPYDLKNLFVLPDDGCDKYKKIPIPRGSILRKPSMRVVYNFMNKFDKVINDITAKETKPWLDFTLQHFYPEYIVDYGNLGDLDNTKAGLECLLEMELGIGNGKVVDYLASEILSAFSSIEKQISEQACRSLTELSTQGATAVAESKDKGKTPLEERSAAMKARYEKEFENKALNQLIDQYNEAIFPDSEEVNPSNLATRSNVIDKMKKAGLSFPVRILIKEDLPYSKSISTKEDLINYKKEFANVKFAALEFGNFGDQLQNSPHLAEAMDAANEVLQNFEDTYVKVVKDAIEKRSEFDIVDVIPAIGVCGFSKIAGKALNCIANGVSFDDFLDILIEKTFDFMEVNTLSLFFNGLPASFRSELNKTIEEQFGKGADISTLIGIKMAEGEGQKMKDFVKSKQHAKRVKDLFEKYQDPLEEGTEEEIDYLKSQLGHNRFGLNPYDQIMNEMSVHYNRQSGVYIDGPITRKIDDNEREYKKREKFVTNFINSRIRGYKQSQNKFRQAFKRVSNTVAGFTEDIRDSAKNVSAAIEERREIKDAIDNLDALIDGEKATIDEIFKESSFNADGTIADFGMTKSQKLELMRQTSARIVDYRNLKEDLESQLDGYVKREISSEIGELKNRLDFLVDQGLRNTTQSGAEILRAFDDVFKKSKETSLQQLAQAADSFVITGEELDDFEQAAKSFQETALGVKVDAVFDVIFDFLIDSIMSYFSADELLEKLRSYPAIDFALDKVESLFLNSCPVAPVFYPPPGDFMKSLSVDVCDPTFSLTFPKLIVPNINLRFKLEYQFNEIFREAIIKLVSEAAVSLLKRLMKTLESSLCNLVESAGGIVASGLRGELKGSFYRALNEAFCNDGEDPETSRSKAEQLAEALFAPLSFDEGADYEDAGAKVANIISSVASTEEFLEAMVARDGEENDQFNSRIANAVNALAPEMNVLLGDPNQVAFFFKSLGSFLPPEERNRIRDMLDAGVPNLPISQAICLTNDQLNEWNNLREGLLGDLGFRPAEDYVKKLNDATLDALAGTMDDIGDLESDGPFIGSATNEMLKDVCNPNNIMNEASKSETDRDQENELINGFFDNISRSLTFGFFTKGGLLSEAMRDTTGRREFARSFQKIFRINYSNSQEERDQKYGEAGRFKQFFMDIGYDADAGAPGVYPETVGAKQREEILSDSGTSYNFTQVKKGKGTSKNVVYRYADEQDGFSYKQIVSVSNLRKAKKTFGYNVQVLENINDTEDVLEVNFNSSVFINEGEERFLQNKGFQYKQNEEKDIRKAAFNSIMKSMIPINKDFGEIYESLFETSNKKLIEALLTNYESSDGFPNGYKFGYVTDDLTKDSFEYTPSPNEGELGTFASSRIIALSPEIYGGNYKNPPYYVEPRKFFGWLELATNAFDSQEGCDPKTPPMISFKDIKDRVSILNDSLRTDPRLSKSPDCVSVKPFHLLLDSKNKAKLDGVIRTTIRTYLAEFFMKGYGLFSNLQIREENFDDSMMSYIARKMQTEMSQLGVLTSNKKVRIVRERYWFTFLEQCVEAYQRMIDVDGIEPPDDVLNALNRIQLGLDKFRVVDKNLKKKAIKELRDITLSRPSSDYDSLSEMKKGSVYNLAMAVDFRLAKIEERENFFDGSSKNVKVDSGKIRFSSLKKLKFFQKIYFIKLFEQESLIVMKELIKNELNRLSQNVIDGPTDKPYYFDLYKSFFGMKSFFSNSSSRVGLNSYYLGKQTGTVNAGSIQDLNSDNKSLPKPQTDKVQFIVQSYVRFEEKESPNIPNFIRSRNNKYYGAVSLSNTSEFISDRLDDLDDVNLSDYFGNLSFTYKSTFKTLMDKGFANQQSISRLIDLNKEIDSIKFTHGLRKYLSSREFEDFELIHDETFLLDGETPTPQGTIGSTGVKYGLRVSAILPKGSFSEQELDSLKSNPDFVRKSLREKSYLFDDGGFMIPLASTEIDVVDCSFEQFDPFNGIERYDLECLINKIVKQPEFTVMFDKLLNFRQTSSMLAIYCMETLPASFGRGEGERVEEDPEIEEFDGIINQFGKNFLRREFKSLYLSNTEDGLSPDDDDDDSEFLRLIKISNPFDSFALPSIKLPWWMKRRMRTKIYDANGQECADPEKDLQ